MLANVLEKTVEKPETATGSVICACNDKCSSTLMFPKPFVDKTKGSLLLSVVIVFSRIRILPLLISPLKVASPVTPSVELSVVAPVTLSVSSTSKLVLTTTRPVPLASSVRSALLTIVLISF